MKRHSPLTVTRRRVIAGAAASLVASLAAACGRVRSPTPLPTTATPPAPPTPPPTVSAPSVVPTPVSAREVHVNALDPAASDMNDGAVASPVRTIAQAVQLALGYNKQHRSARIVVYPGTYREAVQVSGGGAQTDAPLTLEAKEHGSVIVSGSDVWTGWRKDAATGLYTHPWPYRWGMAPYPQGWQGQVELKPIVRRREMIFINGAPLSQVLTRQEVKAGTFYVAEDSATAYLSPPSGVAIEGTTVEVAVRAGTFVARDVPNFTVRGLIFVHDNVAIDGAAVAFNNCDNLLAEDCQFLRNNWTGFSVHASSGVVARGNVANYNGAIGMEAYQVKDVHYDGNETSYNNWRGARGQFYGWATGGLKHLLVHGGTYSRHRSVGNQACGCWFDTDCANVAVDGAFCAHNYGEGIFLEASQGPLTVTNSTIAHNQQGPGVYSEGATDVTLRDNILYDNGDAQIRALKGMRPVTNWETHKDMQLVAERWTLRGNIIVGTDNHQNLIDAANRPRFVGSLTSDENLWFNMRKDAAFVVEGTGYPFAMWQSTTKQDMHSLLADPRFVNPGQDEFNLRDDSPLRNRPTD